MLHAHQDLLDASKSLELQLRVGGLVRNILDVALGLVYHFM